MSAAAAEGYFSGLGYEVDEQGVPVDPDDWGYAIAEARRAAMEAMASSQPLGPAPTPTPLLCCWEGGRGCRDVTRHRARSTV